jgi:hypothetical protein
MIENFFVNINACTIVHFRTMCVRIAHSVIAHTSRDVLLDCYIIQINTCTMSNLISPSLLLIVIAFVFACCIFVIVLVFLPPVKDKILKCPY